MKKSPRKKSSKGKKAPVPVKAVDFVMYCAKEPLKLRAWYKEIFGLEKGDEWNAYWSEFATKPVTFCLNGPSTRSDPKWDWLGTPAIAFAVEDIHAAATAFSKRGIKILKGPVNTNVCWMLFIEDPEGNRLVLHQRKDGTSG
jgi:predicted enzyme related to lactoylglutathione lyase